MKGMTIGEATTWRINMSAMGLTHQQVTGMVNLAEKLQRDTILQASAFAKVGENAIKAGRTYDDALAAMNLHHAITVRRMRTGI